MDEILIDEKLLSAADKDNIIGITLVNNGDADIVTDIIKSTYRRDLTVTIKDGVGSVYNYYADDYGIHISAAAKNAREYNYKWTDVAARVAHLINEHEYVKLNKIESEAAQTDIIPIGENSDREQLSLFSIDEKADESAIQSYAVSNSPVIEDRVINSILKVGAYHEKNSLEQIVLFFANQNHSLKDKSLFLCKHFLNEGDSVAVGYTASDDADYAVLYKYDGITIAAGNSVYDDKCTKVTISWEDAANRIDAMLDEGEYTYQEVIDRSKEVVAEMLALQIWKCKKETEGALELPNAEIYTGTTACLPTITDKILHDRDWVKETAKALLNAKIKWIYRETGRELSARLADMLAAEKEYTANENIGYPATPIVNQDHIELFFSTNSGYYGTEQRIRHFFAENPANMSVLAEELKKEYGNGGRNNFVFNFNGMAKGGATFKVRQDEKQITWNNAAHIVANSIKNGRYFTAKYVLYANRNNEYMMLGKYQNLPEASSEATADAENDGYSIFNETTHRIKSVNGNFDVYKVYDDDTLLLNGYKALQRLSAVRIGDFYEFYGNDAETAADVLDLALTKRQGNAMAGVPIHAIERYEAQLNDAGYALIKSEVQDRKISADDISVGDVFLYKHQTYTVNGLIGLYPNEFSITRNNGGYAVTQNVDKQEFAKNAIFLFSAAKTDEPIEEQEKEEAPVVQPTVDNTEKRKIPNTLEHRNYLLLKEIFPKMIDRTHIYERYQSINTPWTEESGGIEPVSIEWIGKTRLSIMHTYTQNGDLMRDPEIVCIIDDENQTAIPKEYEMSSLGIYENYEVGYSKDVSRVLNVILQNIQQYDYYMHRSIEEYNVSDDSEHPDYIDVELSYDDSGAVIDIDCDEATRSRYLAEKGVVVKQPQEEETKNGINNAEELKTDYVLSENNFDNLGGAKSKFKANAEAIKLLKELEFDGRTATLEEQEILSKYIGWGGLSQAFDENNSAWANEFTELYTMLSPEEYESARKSTQTAFYTEPFVVKSIYAALNNMGFNGGTVLEPACGTGNFIGSMPVEMRDNSRVYGVELDDISGKIAKQLYQNADISVCGYEEKYYHDNFFDVAVGNVPFGDIKVFDKKYRTLNLKVHDYFFAKTLDKVRPNGIIAFVTSSYTLDKNSSKFRSYLAERADLLGAIRLPNTAFKRVAGTEVTSDIIFLQKRETRRVDLSSCDWITISSDRNGVPINNYFVEHPQMVLGEMKQGAEYSMYGNENGTACVAPDGYDLKAELAKAVQNIEGVYKASVPVIAFDDDENDNPKETIPAREDVSNFSYCIIDNKAYYRENSIMTRVDKNEERIIAMTRLKNTVRQLIDYQLRGVDEALITNKRTELNETYDSFVKKFGYLASKANQLAYQADSGIYILLALEKYDKDVYVGKTDIFEKNTISPVKQITSVETAQEALGLCIGQKGYVDIDFIADLCKKDVDTVIADLRGQIFRLPPMSNNKAEYVTADEYLSGDLNEKIATAIIALTRTKEPWLQENIDALNAAMPAPLKSNEVFVRIGTNWIPTDDYNKFMEETFKIYCGSSSWECGVEYNALLGSYNIRNKTHWRSSVVTSTYGTNRLNAVEIMEKLLNMSKIEVREKEEYTKPDGTKGERSVVNVKETEMVQIKAESIKEAFGDWIWKDEERRERLLRYYNQTFNSRRSREYNGDNIIFHGINDRYELRPHQKKAIARTLYGGNSLLAHAVGAGKTFEMVASVVESKALGLCNKALICVPNHIVGQFGKEFLELYPSANILVATEKDFSKHRRKTLFARIATGDYDAVIIGHSQLIKLPLSNERLCSYLQQDIDRYRAFLDEQAADAKRNNKRMYGVKQIEKKVENLKVKLRELIEAPQRDDVICFEELGIDRLYIDEAHYFKNLAFNTHLTRIAGLSNTDAQKTQDLYYKVKYLDELTNHRGVIFATGTPYASPYQH